jgi:predicted transcriptional regulator
MSSSHGMLENIILNAVWHTEQYMDNPISVADIQDKINQLNKSRNWAYTTVKTVLDRLVDKGFIDRIKDGKKYFYKSVIPREELGGQAIKKIAKQYYNDDMTLLLKAIERIHHEEMACV